MTDLAEELKRICVGDGYDDASVRALDRQYVKDGRWIEAGMLAERVGFWRTEWPEKVSWFKRAVNRFYHADEMAACVICHRQALACIPEDLSSDKKLDGWWPTGLSLAYPYVGAGEDALEQVDRLAEDIQDWSIYGRSVYHGTRVNVFQGWEDWEAMIKEAQSFVDWAKSLPHTDPTVNRAPPNIETGGYHTELVGELGRWYCIIGALSEKIAKAQKKIGSDTSITFLELKAALESLERESKVKRQLAEEEPDNPELSQQSELYEQRFRTCLDMAGEAATECGRYEEALECFEREEAIRGGSLYVYGPLYRAASLIALGRTDAAKECLAGISGSMITSGRALTRLQEIEQLRPLTNDPDFAAILSTWNGRNSKS